MIHHPLVEKYLSLHKISTSFRRTTHALTCDRKVTHPDYDIIRTYGVHYDSSKQDLILFCTIQPKNTSIERTARVSLNELTEDDQEYMYEVNSSYIALEAVLKNIESDIRTALCGKKIKPVDGAPTDIKTISDVDFTDGIRLVCRGILDTVVGIDKYELCD